MMLIPWIYKIPDFGFINKEAYQNYKTSKKQIIINEAAPDAAVQHKRIIYQVPVSKKIKAAPINQKALF